MKHCPEPSIRERMGKFARRHPGLCGSTSIALISVVLIGLLGGTVALGYDKMQDLFARVRIRSFDREFTEIQFLLNTAGNSQRTPEERDRDGAHGPWASWDWRPRGRRGGAPGSGG